MIDQMDALMLARIQFAFVISFHIVFPAFSIGLASFLTVLEFRWLKTGEPIYAEVYKHWVKIFAVVFGMGVVSGVVMSYQFGTNWAVFSDKAGNVLGPLLAYEVLTAFFLEASFLGIMLFGWGRVSKRMHFASTAIVAIGTLISGFWILAANSFMQTPQGFMVGADGLLYPTNWLEIIFNPSFPFRYAHMMTAAFLTTAFVIGGIGAYYIQSKKHTEHRKHGRVMLGMAMVMAIFVAPAQVLIGDMHGLNTLEHQPAKVAAMEGLWEDERGAPLVLFGIPDQEAQKNHYEVKIPYLSGLILTHSLDGEVKGLKNWAPEDQPYVPIVFWSFRVMVGIGTLMVLVGLFSLYKYFKKQQYNPESKWFHRAWMMMTPLGFVALLAGWFVTETGRQPWTVYEVIRTAESMSPVAAQQVATTLIGFIVLYIFVFGAGSFYILRLIAQGPKPYEDPADDNIYEHSITEGQGRTLSGDNNPSKHTKKDDAEDLDTPADDIDDGGLR
ncbi:MULTISPECIES: cytochrome ubiquinol oxidase subunit I [unclassified Psychrobacter]|uniref:cytochrome ubiquinol oxidase subunit I n=2 Tax=unclassified Psychrobacter TaxID=196806 RepID=UPI002116C2F1|nr:MULTISPECIES: cytochrome ubiquinol oxidase subunit I [unclassified Psychrobacter]